MNWTNQDIEDFNQLVAKNIENAGVLKTVLEYFEPKRLVSDCCSARVLDEPYRGFCSECKECCGQIETQ